jgi:16S rRNA (cytidine1402-2'-O)-methyltransferase
MNNTRTLFLIPTVLAEGTIAETLSPGVIETIKGLDVFFVENIRTARRFISSLKLGKVIDEITFYELAKNTPPAQTLSQLKSLTSNAGVLSEAGVPCVADPGSVAVKFAHEMGYRVKPLTGPSSILLALMGSGFTGQSFIFHGYLPIDRGERNRRITELENQSTRTGQTQIFMETPYRNNQMFHSILASCQANTRLCIASNITAQDEFLETHTIAQWKKSPPELNKKPTIFLIGVA